MYIIEQSIPTYLTSKQNITRTVLFTAAFALAFINFYSPFGVEVWLHEPTKLELFVYSSLVILTGMLVVAISRIFMYHYSKKNKISYVNYAVWVLGEIVSMAAFYSLFGTFVLEEEDKAFLDTFKRSIRNTALVLLLPYSILWLYFAWRDKIEELQRISASNQPLAGTSKKMLPFYDEKRVLKFSILLDDLLYLEAADNYVTIYYVDKSKVSKFLIRNTLKYYEENSLSNSLIRCHRSYIVNSERVKIIRKEKEGLVIDLDSDPQVSLPVSKSYVSNIIEGFSKMTE